MPKIEHWFENEERQLALKKDGDFLPFPLNDIYDSIMDALL